MITEHVLEDEELGRLLVRVNIRARRLTFRTREDAVHVTVPPGTTIGEVKNAVEQLRSRLRVARQRQSRPLIDLNYRIDTEFFKLSLVSGERDRFLSRSELGEMQIICPPNADFSNKELQAWLRKVIEEALRRNAKIILPPRLYALSLQHNLSYKSMKINSSSGRWGSCSARGNINLSYFLVLLPRHLIDYVLLHELAHTREMNHGERFWALLNGMTDGKAQLLRNELRKYKTGVVPTDRHCFAIEQAQLCRQTGAAVPISWHGWCGCGFTLPVPVASLRRRLFQNDSYRLFRSAQTGRACRLSCPLSSGRFARQTVLSRN